MKIAHVCNYAPGLSGMYGTTRDLILAERKIGLEAEMIDDALALKAEYGKDGITPVPVKYGDEADIICWHHAMVEEWFNEPHRNLVLFLHGTPEYNLMTELHEGDKVLSLLVGLANMKIPKAMISLWKRHIPIWENLLKTKVHYVPAWTDINKFTKTKREVQKDTIKLAMMDFWRLSREPFGLLEAIDYLRKNTNKKIEVDVWGLVDQPNKTWQAVIQWMIEDGVMNLKGNTKNVQEDIFDQADMVLTMSTEETRVVREAYCTGTPVVCGRGPLDFTDYSCDSIDVVSMARVINKCHDDLINNQSTIRSKLRAYAVENFESEVAAREVKKIFEEILNEHGSVNHPKIKKVANRITETAAELRDRFTNNKPTAFVTFDAEEIRMIVGTDLNNTSMALKKAFSFKDKKIPDGYVIGSSVGLISEGRMRKNLFGMTSDDAELRDVVSKTHKKTLENGLALQYLFVYEPHWMIDFAMKLKGKKVVYIGPELTCSGLLKKMFNVETMIPLADVSDGDGSDDAYNYLLSIWHKVTMAAQHNDVMICGSHKLAPIIAHKLWDKGFRINFFDLDYIPHALVGIKAGPAAYLDDVSSVYNKIFINDTATIIIPTHVPSGCSDLVNKTAECMQLVKNNTNNYNVIWVDDCSGEPIDEIKTIASGMSDCELITNNKRDGYPIAINKALRKVIFNRNCEWVVLLDNDVRVTKGWLEKCISAAITNDLDIVGPMMSSGRQSIEAIKSIHTIMPDIGGTDRESISRELITKCGAKVMMIPIVSTACCVMRRSVVDQIGLFDESIGHSHSGSDLCGRAYRTGKRIGVALGAYVEHDGGATVNKLDNELVKKERAESTRKFDNKWSAAPRVQ